MKKFLLFCFSALANANQIMPSIQFGTDAPADTHQFITSIFIQTSLGGLRCTGSLIDKSWVLTAAHCVQETHDVSTKLNPSQVFVTINDYDLYTHEAYQVTRAVTEVKQHPDWPGYSAGGYLISSDHDLAVLKLSAPITNIDLVYVATEGNFDAAVDSGNPGIVLGWGVTDEGSTSNLKIANVVPSFITSDTVSSISADNNNATAVCSGDSGGPTFGVWPFGSKIQVAVTSGSAGGDCGQISRSIGTRIDSPDNREWLESALGKELAGGSTSTVFLVLSVLLLFLRKEQLLEVYLANKA